MAVTGWWKSGVDNVVYFSSNHGEYLGRATFLLVKMARIKIKTVTFLARAMANGYLCRWLMLFFMAGKLPRNKPGNGSWKWGITRMRFLTSDQRGA